MRMLLGMIFGALLITGVVYVADHWNSAPPTTTGSATGTIVYRPMVNWDVVEDNLRIMGERAQEGWARLSHKVAG
jgi:hypothetical protein